MRVIVIVMSFLAAFAQPLAAEVQNIDNAALARLLEEGVAIVDVRTPPEWQQTGVIKGSKLMMFFDQRGHYDLDGWVGRLQQIVKPDQPVILICRTGNRTPAIAEYLDKKAGYQRVYNVRNGIVRWIDEGHPTVKPELAEATGGSS